jgi:hypothetical protein
LEKKILFPKNKDIPFEDRDIILKIKEVLELKKYLRGALRELDKILHR